MTKRRHYGHDPCSRYMSIDLLLVTDLTMPVMTGDKLIAKLRAKPECQDLSVLVATEHRVI